MDIKSYMKEWRILLLLFFIIISIAMMQPTWVEEDGDYSLAFAGLESNLGTEFTGGTRLLLSLDSDLEGEELREQAEDVSEVLNLRANEIPVVRDPTVQVVNIDGWKVRVTAQLGDTDENLKDLIAQEGTFEARVDLPVRGSKEFQLENQYRFEQSDGDIDVYWTENNSQEGSYQPGDRFTLDDDFSILYLNETEGVSNLELVAYTGDEIADIDDGSMRTVGDNTISLPITLSITAAERYSTITNNFDAQITGADNLLIHDDGSEVHVNFYLDGQQEASLVIVDSPGDSIGTDRSIRISRDDIEEARNEAERIATVLKSGALPVTVSVEGETILGSSLGQDFMRVSIIAVGLSLVAVALIVFARYRRPKIVLPLFMTGSSEVLIVLGLWFSTVGELTLSAVAGLIAAVGTGVDDQIIITDESGREVVRSWTERMKQAFFVIFTSAASTTGAMLPILSPTFANLVVGVAGASLLAYTFFKRGTNMHYVVIGVFAGLVALLVFPLTGTGDALIDIRGFAITTIIGILVGISITRPAYAKTLEYLE